MAKKQNLDASAPIQKTGLGAKASRRISNTIIYAVLCAMTVIWLFPFVGIVLESFKTEAKMQTGYLFPKEFGFDWYVKLFQETDFPKWFLNMSGDISDIWFVAVIYFIESGPIASAVRYRFPSPAIKTDISLTLSFFVLLKA